MKHFELCGRQEKTELDGQTRKEADQEVSNGGTSG